MHSRKTVPIPDLMSAANMELIRLDFKSSTLSRYSKEFRLSDVSGSDGAVSRGGESRRGAGNQGGCGQSHRIGHGSDLRMSE